MSGPVRGDEIIGYTVKEILLRLDAKVDNLDTKFDAVDAKLETKADRDRVHDLAETVGLLGIRVQLLDRLALKRDDTEYLRLVSFVTGWSAIAKYKRWLVATAVGLMTIGVGLITTVGTLIWLRFGG